MEVVELTKPRAFVCENVKALAVLDKWTAIRQRLFRLANQLGYQYKLVVLNSSDFGVPQSRERMFLIGFRGIEDISNLEIQFDRYKKTSPTVRDIVSPLGVAGSKNNQRICNAKVTIAAKPVMRRSPYAGMMFNGQGRPFIILMDIHAPSTLLWVGIRHPLLMKSIATLVKIAGLSGITLT